MINMTFSRGRFAVSFHPSEDVVMPVSVQPLITSLGEAAMRSHSACISELPILYSRN